MKHKVLFFCLIVTFALGIVVARFPRVPFNLAVTAQAPPLGEFDRAITQNAQQMLEEGRRIFRYDTFGSEAWWGDTLKLHRVIEGAKLGGVGPGVSPKTALAGSATSRRTGRRITGTGRLPSAAFGPISRGPDSTTMDALRISPPSSIITSRRSG